MRGIKLLLCSFSVLLLISWNKAPGKGNTENPLRKYCRFSNDTLYTNPAALDSLIPDTFFNNKRIIACGQSSHGSHENFEIQKSIFKLLVEKKGTRAFVLEGHYSNVFRINQYIRYGRGTKDSLLHDLGFKIWQTDELWDLLGWMKNFNAGRPLYDQIIITGNDAQNMKAAALGTLDFLTRYDPAALSEARELLKPMLGDSIFFGMQLTKKTYADLNDRILKVDALMDHMIPQDTDRTNEFAYLKRNGQILAQSLRLYALYSNSAKLNYARDSIMAENVKWVAKPSISVGPVFVWAHNEHIANTQVKSFINMGGRLKAAFGKDYAILGIDFISGSITARDFQKGGSQKFSACTVAGSKQTLSTCIASDSAQLIFFDIAAAEQDVSPAMRKLLKKYSALHSIGQDYYGTKSDYGKLRAGSYDALIFFRHSSPTHLAFAH